MTIWILRVTHTLMMKWKKCMNKSKLTRMWNKHKHSSTSKNGWTNSRGYGEEKRKKERRKCELDEQNKTNDNVERKEKGTTKRKLRFESLRTALSACQAKSFTQNHQLYIASLYVQHLNCVSVITVRSLGRWVVAKTVSLTWTPWMSTLHVLFTFYTFIPPLLTLTTSQGHVSIKRSIAFCVFLSFHFSCSRVCEKHRLVVYASVGFGPSNVKPQIWCWIYMNFVKAVYPFLQDQDVAPLKITYRNYCYNRHTFPQSGICLNPFQTRLHKAGWCFKPTRSAHFFSGFIYDIYIHTHTYISILWSILTHTHAHTHKKFYLTKFHMKCLFQWPKRERVQTCQCDP